MIVVGDDIHQPRGEPAPSPARATFRPDDPTPQFNRFLPAERDREGRIGGVEQMMTLVEQDSRRRVLARPGRVDHHQRMVGDDDVGFPAGAFGALDEAAAVMRAAGIDALSAPIGQRGCSGAAEQARQPAGQVAADHVAVLGIGRPAADQLGEDCGTPREGALQGVLQVEQAEVVFTTLADHDPPRPLRGVGEQLWPLAVELALQGLGEGRDPHRPRRPVRPQRGRRKVSERLADARARLGEQHVRGVFRALGREHRGHRLGHGALALAWLDPAG